MIIVYIFSAIWGAISAMIFMKSFSILVIMSGAVFGVLASAIFGIVLFKTE